MGRRGLRGRFGAVDGGVGARERNVGGNGDSNAGGLEFGYCFDVSHLFILKDKMRRPDESLYRFRSELSFPCGCSFTFYNSYSCLLYGMKVFWKGFSATCCIC